MRGQRDGAQLGDDELIPVKVDSIQMPLGCILHQEGVADVTYAP
jgi:hypothetical protein